jgi:uncharacterized protein (DUF342 family)
MSQFTSKLVGSLIGAVLIVSNGASIVSAAPCCAKGSMANVLGSSVGTTGSSFNSSRTATVGYTDRVIAQGKQLQERLASLQANYDRASSHLAQLQQKQLLASNGSLSYHPVTAAEMKAAKATQTQAAIALNQAQVEARQFLQTLKNPTPDLLQTNKSIW